MGLVLGFSKFFAPPGSVRFFPTTRRTPEKIIVVHVHRLWFMVHDVPITTFEKVLS